MNNVIFLNLIFLIFCFTNCEQSKRHLINIPSDFIETKPPEPGSEEWHSLNRSLNEYNVENIKGQLKISYAKERNNCELITQKGKLQGIDNGEWGGKLTFIPKDITKDKIEIKEGNIKGIFSFQNNIYFIEGLAHLGINKGALFRLDESKVGYNYTKILDLEDAPEAYSIL